MAKLGVRACTCRANLPRRFNAVEFRHREIHQDQIRIRAIRLQHAFSAVGGLDDSIAFRAQPRRQECPIIRIIVDYKNDGRGFWPPCWLSSDQIQI